jgi:hypothetical protein
VVVVVVVLDLQHSVKIENQILFVVLVEVFVPVAVLVAVLLIVLLLVLD